jgi:hypothetical protein
MITMTPKKEYVLNPISNRMIIVGNRPWIDLVKAGILESNYQSNDITNDSNDQIKNKITELNKNNKNKKIQYVRGRGVYKNNIVERRLELKPYDIIKETIKKTKELQKDETEELNEKLENLILTEVMKGRVHKSTKFLKDKPIYSQSTTFKNCQIKQTKKPLGKYRLSTDTEREETEAEQEETEIEQTELDESERDESDLDN